MAIIECVVDTTTTHYCSISGTEEGRVYLDGVDFWRDSGNATQAILHCNVNSSVHFTWMQWIMTSGFIQIGAKVWANGTGSENQTISQQGKGVAGCHEQWYWMGGRFIDVYANANTTQIHLYEGWEFDSSINAPAHGSNGWWGPCVYNLPANKRITNPQGFSVNYATTLSGTTTASITGWGEASNITGTPTSYPGAEYRNWVLNLMDSSGNYLAHICHNRGETKNDSWTNPQFYTAEVLEGTSQANSSKYTIQKNKAYKLRAQCINSFVRWYTGPLSNLIYSDPPTPNVSISSIIYKPATKNCDLTFTWSKPSDGGALKEVTTYSVYDAKGNYYKTNVQLATNAAGSGSAKSGTITVTGLPSGEQYFVAVKVSQYKTDGTTVLNSKSKTATSYAPVANAAFLGFDWDELRRECTIRAEAPGAANCRIQAGYAPNNYTVGNKLTSGQVGTLVVKDLNHGSGQILYLQATPEASDGHQYLNEIAKISVPIPNPILGLVTPSCEDIERGVEKRYIVDFVEHKKNNTCTPRWQNGDRIVKKDECGQSGDVDATAPVGAAGVCLSSQNPFAASLKVLPDGWVSYSYVNPGTVVTTTNTGNNKWGYFVIAFGAPTTGRLSFDFSWVKPGHKYQVRIVTRNGDVVTPMPTDSVWWKLNVTSAGQGVGLSLDGQWHNLDLSKITSITTPDLGWYWAEGLGLEPRSPWPIGAAATSGFEFKLEYREVA